MISFPILFFSHKFGVVYDLILNGVPFFFFYLLISIISFIEDFVITTFKHKSFGSLIFQVILNKEDPSNK